MDVEHRRLVHVVLQKRDELAVRGRQVALAAACAAGGRLFETSSCGLTTSLTGRPSFRAAATASGVCVHGHSLPPNPDPRNLLMTRTFSTGKPNICASTLRQFTIPCVESYTVNIEPSQLAVVACSSSGLCVSVGVT